MAGTQVLVLAWPGTQHEDFGAGSQMDLTRAQFNKTVTSVIYKCSLFFRLLSNGCACKLHL